MSEKHSWTKAHVDRFRSVREAKYFKMSRLSSFHYRGPKEIVLRCTCYVDGGACGAAGQRVRALRSRRGPEKARHLPEALKRKMGKSEEGELRV